MQVLYAMLKLQFFISFISFFSNNLDEFCSLTLSRKYWKFIYTWILYFFRAIERIGELLLKHAAAVEDSWTRFNSTMTQEKLSCTLLFFNVLWNLLLVIVKLIAGEILFLREFYTLLLYYDNDYRLNNDYFSL